MWIVTVMKIGNVTVNKHITGKHINNFHTEILRSYSLRYGDLHQRQSVPNKMSSRLNVT